MTTGLLIQIVLGALPFITAFAAFQLSTKSHKVQAESAAKAVDAEAFSRAKAIYEGAIGQLKAELAATRAELAEARAELAKVRDCPELLDRAGTEISGLKTEVGWLREQLRRMRYTNGGMGPGAPAG